MVQDSYPRYITTVGDVETLTWSGMLDADGIEIDYVNTKKPAAPTGLSLDSRPFGWLMGGGTLLGILVLLTRKRRFWEDPEPPGRGGSGRSRPTDPQHVRKRDGPPGSRPGQGPPQPQKPPTTARSGPQSLTVFTFNEELNIENYI